MLCFGFSILKRIFRSFPVFHSMLRVSVNGWLDNFRDSFIGFTLFRKGILSVMVVCKSVTYSEEIVIVFGRYAHFTIEVVVVGV